MAKKKFSNSLNSQMLRVTLIPLTLMAIIIVSVSVSGLYQLVANKTKEELIRDAQLAQYVLNSVYVGEYWAEDADGDGEPEMYKGEQRINGDDMMVDDLANMLEIEISVFYNDVRLITTLKDSNGNRATGTSASVIVKKEVLEDGASKFYSNVMVYDKKSYAYYMPLVSEAGKTEGMIAVSRSQESVKQELLQYIFPICVTCGLTAFLMGYIMVYFNRKLAGRIRKMDKYMNTLADGNFDVDMPRELMLEDDEIKHLANDGKRMAKAIQMLVDFDALTELNNRRYADKKLEEIRIKSVERGMKYCLCISDIDFFKKVNDTFGHEMGDYVLKKVAEKLKAGMIGKGMAARWGGEEFMLIFENRELDIARRELEIIMDEVRTIWVPDSDRQITMSFGLTALEPGEDIDDALKRADDNLYQAKESGRNQIICK
ncbi:diguanylate cyclase domain-containing protein [Pseudobutyrivibrio xylanivorans]|uniref:Diguanylate cyclase (GGDEF) domain-containing protein n=1 Tax=Pseudobutyrivibrio xylanivorans DSM 14809 TaxID=1123012 RepID=A0A1M6F7Z2_PSEXY|nr:diguanylate cyclase [Pseudobutyrivibrio xylanivorans]SHI93864.1 diguanylate cyclase (GGDEF) domain-containing protein [Pseudobutyrivibrio xylanivorans DSM 14809]